MFNLEKITKIQSLEAERVLEFYRIQEELCEEAPLALWRNGAKTKGSDIHVELKLLTDKARTTYFRNVSGQSPKEESNNQLNSQQTSAEANSESNHSSQSKDKQQNKTKVEDLPEEQNNQKQLVLWEKIFGGKGLRVIFKGGAGSGKSFSLTQEIRKRISKAKSELENFRHTIHEVELPIFVKASAFISSNQQDIVDVILEQIPGLSDSANLGSWFRNAFESENGKRLFIVIDGLDELPETAQRIFRDRTKQLEDKLKSASLVVSCRTMYFDDRRDWISWATERRTKVIELAPLEEKQQIELIEKLNQNNNKSNHTLIGLVKNNLSLNHFCKTPLIMASACWLYSEGELSEDTTYSSLYKALTKKILRGDWKELENRPKWVRSKSNVQRDADFTDRTDLLSHICWQLFEASSSENRFSLKQWREAFDKTPKRFKKKKLSVTKLLKELEMVGMIINAGYDSDHNPCYSFVHRTILEYFTAVGLVNHSDESFYVRTIVKHIWCEKEWFEVIR